MKLFGVITDRVRPKCASLTGKAIVSFGTPKARFGTFNGDDVRVPFKDPNQSLRRAMATDGTFSDEEVKEYREKGKIPENWWEIPHRGAEQKPNTRAIPRRNHALY